jgi:hypothetical protein
MHVLLLALHVLLGDAFVAGCALGWQLSAACLVAAGSTSCQQLVKAVACHCGPEC